MVLTRLLMSSRPRFLGGGMAVVYLNGYFPRLIPLFLCFPSALQAARKRPTLRIATLTPPQFALIPEVLTKPTN
jgi:hypothetical protein